MEYSEALHWIHTREKFKVKPGLKRMEWMMDRLGHPENQLHAIHVAGTNGKGSTVSFLRHLLQGQGYTVGTFTSPYIVRFNERISMNGEPVSDYELIELVEAVKPLVEGLGRTEWGEPTEFEVITAMAFIYFQQRGVDFAIFETGLGGRYDSTNVINPILSIITNIGRDHTDILGHSIEEIAYQKAGIIKKGKPVLTCVKQQEALAVIKEESAKQKADLFVEDYDFIIQYAEHTKRGEAFYMSMGEYFSPKLLTQLKGIHQTSNAGLALAAIEKLKELGYLIQRDFYAEAINTTIWPARFERVQEEPDVVLDGAHNVEGTMTLIKTLKDHYPNRTIYLLYGAVQNKPVKEMLTLLNEVVNKAWYTTFSYPKALRAIDVADLSPIKASRTIEDQQEALQDIMDELTEEDVLVITGSLYFISDIRKYFE
ncbi:folylpolyglutamate synthase/dihydrofolate synthase family protein [Halobacillus sp. A5]|uniref:bifunctional folylpolyglutamate synthase/dihydrofolate synthase n=1 Tax=Halobacillus sp. A5 TaxID=2880263 RepID=UPI0020A6B684|nr:folylpolyglutamate synthase/dihydrofolate synthase family protein [Halobacillus sp. A5]MCP3025532.1 bifunctional folylpolyglutamate synthase/dihydrofolate synthase [Halobacillus sp. A5]